MAEETKSVPEALAGPLTTLASASFFAIITPLATFVYGAGGNSITLVFIRLLTIVLLAIGVSAIFKKIPRLEKRNLPGILIFALCVFGQGFCYLSSVVYIPVSLAALLLYTWPIMAALSAPLIGEKSASGFQMLCFAGAFSGLIVTFGPSLENLDPRGVTLALLAACFTVGLILSSRIVLRHSTTLSVSLYGNFFAMLLAGVFVPLMGGFLLPETTTGILVLGLICLAFSAAVATQLLGLRTTSASLASMIYNMEPVISIIVAFILLGEILTPPQYVGGVIVIISLMLFSRPSKKQQARI